MNIYTGKKYVLKRKIIKKDIKIFSNLSGDKNPIHIDQKYSKKMGFGKIVAHGMLSETFISAIIGNNLPGPGSLWAEKNIKFLKIVREGDIVILKSEITEIHKSNNLAIVEIKAFNQFKELVFDSINKIILPKNAKIKNIQNNKKKLINKKLKEKKINVKKNLAIIIGASGGIGLEVTKKLLKKNFDVIAFYNSSFKDLKKLKISNKNLSYLNLNLQSKKSLEKCLNVIKKNHPTHFINCFSPKIYPINFDKITNQDFDHYFDKSLINIFLIIKECVKRFKLIRRGNIIDISSIYLKLPELNLLPYITFKGSMSAMIKSLSAELASFNIRANSVTGWCYRHSTNFRYVL
jgi:acyl dehydratase/NADP-dependent 3-hydroxy acid dehydrogenase YdfG